MKFRHTNFMRLIYATLLALPFVAILSRVIYVQSNKNAYQSYYGATINQRENVNVTLQKMQPNSIYYFYNCFCYKKIDKQEKRQQSNKRRCCFD